MVIVDRTCRELLREAEDPTGGVTWGEPKPLGAFRSRRAYVLLGDPGAGKTTEFSREQVALGNESAVVVSARDLRTFDVHSQPDWWNRTLFIDSLDEARAGATNLGTVLDDIRAKLAQLNKPSFRLCCREADWLGPTDRQHLRVVSPDFEVTVLRLDPLDRDSTDQLLRLGHRIEDPAAFMRAAHLNGVYGLLGNPLTLDLLARVVKQRGDWPHSRADLLDRACRLLAGEHNAEHRAIRTPLTLSPDTAVDSAGYLCTLLLVAGMDSVSVSGDVAAPGVAFLDELSDPPGSLSRQALEQVLHTKLFTAGAAPQALAPLHRQVSEYLAGRHLARRIEMGLPAGRVVSLITAPSDGRGVTGLRGLSAWLAAYSPEARWRLIAADPVGVGLYGDIGRFDLADKERLIEAFSESLDSGEEYWDETAWAFRSLASPELVPSISEVLNRLRERRGDDRSASLVLGLLEHAEAPDSVAGLSEGLVAVVEDDGVPTFLRKQALDAYLHLSTSDPERGVVLKNLLEEIGDGSISDPDADLRGTLLGELYPAVLGPSELWDHLVARGRDGYLGILWGFKKKTLLERAQDHDVVELLDTLHARADGLVPALKAARSDELPQLLLERALAAQGETVDPQRLSGWLTTVRRVWMYSGRGSSAGIRSWLEERPPIQKAVLLASLRQWAADGPTQGATFWQRDVLHGSRLPSDFGRWCLDQAVALATTEPDVAQELLGRAYESSNDLSMDEDLAAETIRERIRELPVLVHRFDELTRPSLMPREDESDHGIEEEWRRRADEYRREREELRQGWVEYLRDNEADLRENRFPPPDLHELAKSYLGLFVDDDEDAAPTTRVSDFVGADQQLVDAVLTGLAGAVLRDEVPSVEETILLYSDSRHSSMAYPVLASMDLVSSREPMRLALFDDERKRRVLAIYYCVPGPFRYRRAWYRRWLEDDPALVLEVLSRCALAGVRAGKRLPPGINDLDAATGCDDLVHQVRLRLLDAYPLQGSNEQLPLLDDLLTKTLGHLDRTQLLALARRKQALRSMTVGQRVRWWATDALISQDGRLQELKPDLVSSEIRVKHLAEFLSSVWNRHDRGSPMLSETGDPMTLSTLIEILGRWCNAPFFQSGHYTLKMKTSDLIMRLINQLASAATPEARQALERLTAESDWAGWRDQLVGAYGRQSVAYRDASFRYPDIRQVEHTLRDDAPAHIGDLWALLSDRLQQFSERVRTDSRNVWRQFWNVDGFGRPKDPRPENACRDVLLDQLDQRLPLGVMLESEASHAADWRADISARYGDFSVPIEIKRDRHPDLWRSLRSQLIGQYTTDPATSGHGLYIVLWFGDGRVHSPPDGKRPRTPGELEQRLAQDLTPDEALIVSVVVIDVSKPSPPAG